MISDWRVSKQIWTFKLTTGWRVKLYKKKFRQNILPRNRLSLFTLFGAGKTMMPSVLISTGYIFIWSIVCPRLRLFRNRSWINGQWDKLVWGYRTCFAMMLCHLYNSHYKWLCRRYKSRRWVHLEKNDPSTSERWFWYSSCRRSWLDIDTSRVGWRRLTLHWPARSKVHTSSLSRDPGWWCTLPCRFYRYSHPF